MPKTFHSSRAPYFALLLLLAACHGHEKPVRPSSDFIPYIPAFTAGHVSARAPILVRLADGTALKDTSAIALQKLFELRPDAPGVVTWYDAHTLSYQPRERLKQATTYNVTFHLGELMEVPHELRDFTFGITTYEQNIDLKVTDLQPLSPTDLTWQRVAVSVFTSDDATGQDLEGCVTATQDGKRLKMTWEHEPGGTLHRAVADSVRRGEHASAVEFTWDAKKVGGDTEGGTTFTVPAIGDLKLISSETFTEGDQYAALLFSDPLDATQDLSGLAGIAGVDHVRLSVTGNKLMLYPEDRLTGDQTAFVAAGLRNVNGRPLGKDINVDLNFEEVKPNVRAVGSGTILPSTDGLLFPFEAVNLNAVDVRIVRIYADNVPQFLQVNDMDGEQELARVGRLVLKKSVPLEAREKARPGSWNRYYLDLDKLIKAEPGAIYRVSLGFRQSYSTYPCANSSAKPQLLAPEPISDADEAQWDTPRNYYYYEDYGDYDDEPYDWKERDNPCSASYYRNKGSVVERNILASNIGIIAKRGNDGSMTIAVSDLRTTEPIASAQVKVMDLQQRAMVNSFTGADGLLTVKSTAHKPFLAVVTKGKETGYLKLDEGSALSLSDYDVQGESVDKGLKGFLYGERGVWRPGDSLYLTFILQKAEQKLPKDIPVTLELTDPQGRLDQRLVRTSGVEGTYAFRCATAADAPTGVWGARVIVGGTSFYKPIRIETVKPNRLKILLDLGGERLTANDDKRVQLQSNWLHGAPAKDLKAKVTVSLSRSSASFKGYEQYGFDDLNSDLNTEETPIYEGTLDVNGHASFPFDLHLNRRAPAAVRANVVTRVFEAGGDASIDRTDVQYYPYSAYAGLKVPASSNYWGTWSTDTTYALSAVSVDANGKPLPKHTLRAQVYKVSYSWWWSGDMDEPSNYMNAPSSRIISDTTVVTDASGKAVIPFRVNRPEWGRFVVRLSDPMSGHASAAQLYLDWPGYAGRSRRQDNKEAAMLRFNSDKEKYNVGDRCEITFPSSGAGHALVSLETGSRVLRTEWVQLKKKETKYSFTVTADMAPNIYAYVTLVQPHALTAPDSANGTANDLPIRMYGVIPILVEDAASHLTPVITTAKEFKTDAPFSVEVSEKDGKAMTYTLAIVDEGLLDLTRFKTPDPWHYFYAREALGVRTWDLYGDVIGAFGRQLRRILAIGGSDQANPAEAAKAQRFKPVVRFVGPFQLGKGKKASHTFTISNYVGSVRVMVVANTPDEAYGSAERAVPVRKPLMLLATLPRVVGPGETVDLPVTVFAMDPKVKNVQLALTANALFTIDGPATQALTFASTGEQVVMFRVKMKDAIGVGKVTLTATGAGEKATQRIEIDVRQAGLPETEATEAVVEAGKTYDMTPAALGVTGTNSAYLELSALPPVDLGRRLQYLIDYPHGCLEQTTSKAFPQLYLSDVMDMDDRTISTLRGNVEAGLRKLTQFQTASGGFGYWPGDHEVSEWTSIYAGHFMIEAERKGFVPPPGLKDKWLQYTRREARDWAPQAYDYWNLDRRQLAQAYRLYVLALANNAEAGAMNRMRTTPGLGSQAQWMLAAAYALNNRADVAKEMVKDLSTEVHPYREMGWTYGSGLRDEAIIAEALMRMGDKAGAAGVVKRIAERLNSGEWFSTQSTAWALLAVSRISAGQTPDKAMHFNVSIAEAKAQERMSQKAMVRIDLPVPDGKKKVVITNTGQGVLYVRLVRTGIPVAGEEHPSSSGLAMDVRYETMDGRTIDPGSLTQGTDFQAVVTVQNTGTRGEYQKLALTQVFPSGWEVRNSRLEGTESAQANSSFEYQDIRDDRVLTYFDLGMRRTATYRVFLNASYTGRFHLPSTTCSAMYDNTVNARNGGRWVTVVKPGEAASAQR